MEIVFFAISTFFLFVDGLRHLLSGALRSLHGPMQIDIVADRIFERIFFPKISRAYDGSEISTSL